MLAAKLLRTTTLTLAFSLSHSFSTIMPSIHKLSDRNMDGATIPMSQFEGKILCLVNVASACGYTKSNYEQLSQLYDEFPDKIEILAFPCNQFGAQEPGTHDEICEFVASKPAFNGAEKKFVFFEKADVNGPNAREVYTFLKSRMGGADIGWNFEIFLVDQKGEPVKRFSPSRNPFATLKPEVERLL